MLELLGQGSGVKGEGVAWPVGKYVQSIPFVRRGGCKCGILAALGEGAQVRARVLVRPVPGQGRVRSWELGWLPLVALPCLWGLLPRASCLGTLLRRSFGDDYCCV